MKQKRTRMVQFRLNEEEYQEDLERAEQSGMRQSDYYRSLREQNFVQVIDRSQEIMKELCAIHAALGGDELVSREIVEEGLQRICQCLKQ